MTLAALRAPTGSPPAEATRRRLTPPLVRPAGTAAHLGVRPGLGGAGQLLDLQRLAGNRSVSDALTTTPADQHLQRCGGRACDCTAEERAEKEGAAVQRVATAFQVKGKSPQAGGSPKSIFFDMDSAAIDSTELAKVTALTGTALSTIELKGFASEEETSRSTLIDTRINAVKSELEKVSPSTGTPTLTPNSAAGKGQVDYRSVRRVEILISGAASSVPDCSGGADIDCGPSPNAFEKGHASADGLLGAAITALGSPGADPAKAALNALFGGPGNATLVKDGLTKIKGHMPNMLPKIPLGDTTAGGHRCINSCEGDVLAYNFGTGATARMTVGPKYFSQGDVVEQGLTLIHEGSHGTTGLATEDLAYSWQRLLNFLSVSDALNNADSYTHFVRLIQNPAAVATTRPADSAGALPALRRDAALRSLAFLEQWLVQGRLELRSLYSVVNSAIKNGAWGASDGYYRDNTMAQLAPRFGLTAPPTVPSKDSKERIAGIFDRLFKLRVAITSQGVVFEPGSSPSTWQAGPGQKVTLSDAFFSLSARKQVERLLTMSVDAAAFIDGGQRAGYVGQVKDMSTGYGP